MEELDKIELANFIRCSSDKELYNKYIDLYKKIAEKNKEIAEKNKEIERLNNIINGMEKFFQYAYDNEVRAIKDRKVSVWTICLDKLQELKGSNKE